MTPKHYPIGLKFGEAIGNSKNEIKTFFGFEYHKPWWIYRPKTSIEFGVKIEKIKLKCPEKIFDNHF